LGSPASYTWGLKKKGENNMQITIDDKEIYERIIRMDEGIQDIQRDLKEVKTCMDGHGKRIAKLERNSKNSTIQDWLKKGGIGAGATGLAGTLYLLLDKLIGLGGT
jgi:hypothetical protein